jgi:Tfp pilus assembly protein PilV
MTSARGFTLVEVVVSIGLLTSGFVAFAYVASFGIQLVAEAKYRTFATVAASQKLEQLRATRSLADVTAAAEYLDADGDLVCVGGGPCGEAVYVRRWSIAPAPMYPRSVVVEVYSSQVRKKWVRSCSER